VDARASDEGGENFGWLRFVEVVLAKEALLVAGVDAG
jgi:hypothetical protein